MTGTVRHIIAAILVVFAVSPALAQMNEQEIRTRLDAVYAGKADQVSRELTTLLEQHPHDAGVLYLQAVLTNDGTLAVKRYQAIADTYPQSSWADDALYKLYQYNFSLGLYKKADEMMELLRSRYPQSIYATAADTRGTAQSKRAVDTPSSPKAAATSTPASATPTKNERSAVPPAAETAPVVSPSAAPVQQSQAAQQQAAVPGKFYVQVGVFSTETNARKAAEMYSGLAGRQASVTAKTTGDKTLYLVRFEGFDSSESAHSFSSALRANHNVDSFVFPNANPNAH